MSRAIVVDAPAASDSVPDLGGEWGDAFADASSAKPVASDVADAPLKAKADTTSSSLSELVLDAELFVDADVSPAAEPLDAAPAAAAPEKAPEPAAVLTGDDLSDDDIFEDVEAVSAETPVADVLDVDDMMSAEPHEAPAAEAADVLDVDDVISAKPHEAPAAEAANVLDVDDVISAKPHEAPAAEAANVLDVDAAMSAEPHEAPAAEAADILDVEDVVSAAPHEAPAPEAADVLDVDDVMSAKPHETPAAEAADILDVEDVVSAAPHEAPAPEAADILDVEDVMSAASQEPQPIPQAETVLDAALDAASVGAREPVAAADAPKDGGLLDATELKAAPEAPVAIEASKAEPVSTEPSREAEAPEASVIATPAAPDAEADALEFSLAGDSPKPSASPEAESWQVAAAPKSDAVSSAPSEEHKAEVPPEFDVALVSPSEASPSPEPSAPQAEAPSSEDPVALPKPRLVVAPPAPVRDRTPISLDDLPTSTEEPMQLASTWEFVGWHGGGEGEGAVGHSAETTWADRVVDLDVPAAAPAVSEDGVALASAWEFMQQPWQPQAAAQVDPAQALLAAASASTDTPVDGPAVTAEQVLSALDTADSQGMVGKVLLAYSAGRFRRAFLLGDSFGLARVGRAWGPGSDRPEVTALKVDLDTPSLFTSALNGPSPSVFSAPQVPQDEAIFSALCGESESHLLVFPLHSRGQPVAFFVAEHGPAPLEVSMLEELGRIADRAVEICTRLHRFP
ncbi:hypothetical protein [Corallococcus sp. AS-1-12]|uniref:hypothetical protein n=1 Tax=Corallococcus sp. AS-1-12 TaxID=2874598 RepID=UPI001CBC4166|nr:hypothetical protein [Corallococcus sp. AS-1-12]